MKGLKCWSCESYMRDGWCSNLVGKLNETEIAENTCEAESQEQCVSYEIANYSKLL